MIRFVAFVTDAPVGTHGVDALAIFAEVRDGFTFVHICNLYELPPHPIILIILCVTFSRYQESTFQTQLLVLR